MKFYINGKKVSKKALIASYGEETVKTRIREAREEWQADPLTCMEWMDGMLIENELQY